MVLGALLIPAFTAYAGFFSAILGQDAEARSIWAERAEASQAENSQKMALLEASVFPAPMLKDAKPATSAAIGGPGVSVVINPETEISIESETALLPVIGPLGPGGVEEETFSEDQISVYVVRKGDTIGMIAQMFDVSESTIRWANDIKKGEKLSEGDVLAILPVSGIQHTVGKGETLQSIAKKYKADPEDILFYNNLESSKIAIGDKLVIPDGILSEEAPKPAPGRQPSPSKENYYAKNPIQSLIGYFINPVPTGHKTRGMKPGHRGVDIGAPTGSNIYASASGRVTGIKTGCKVGQTRCGGGYGNMVIVTHPNGTKTLYAHMSRVGTSYGAEVSRGEVIGYVGNTGRSTGPHIHFEVMGAKNPGQDWSWAN